MSANFTIMSIAVVELFDLALSDHENMFRRLSEINISQYRNLLIRYNFANKRLNTFSEYKKIFNKFLKVLARRRHDISNILKYRKFIDNLICNIFLSLT